MAAPGHAAPDKARDQARGNGPGTVPPPAAGIPAPGTNRPAPPAPAPPPPATPGKPPAPPGKAAAPAPVAKPAPAPAATRSTRVSTPGNQNAGCHQTPYGATGPGANHGGAYDDACDGSGSLNGNGGGDAVGKPCAGCVGRADEKNPPGQRPDGPVDHNRGYECDGNRGVGRGNPAHTACADPPPPPCQSTQENPCEPPCLPTAEDPCTTPVCVPGPGVTCAGVLDRTFTRTFNRVGPETPGTEVLGRVFERPGADAAGGSRLALTGADALAPALLGALLLAVGAALATLSRRRPV